MAYTHRPWWWTNTWWAKTSTFVNVSIVVVLLLFCLWKALVR